MYLFYRGRAFACGCMWGGGRGRGIETPADSVLSTNQTRGSIFWPWGHGLSRNQESDAQESDAEPTKPPRPLELGFKRNTHLKASEEVVQLQGRFDPVTMISKIKWCSWGRGPSGDTWHILSFHLAWHFTWFSCRPRLVSVFFSLLLTNQKSL